MVLIGTEFFTFGERGSAVVSRALYSGVRDRGFETHLRRVVSLSKTLSSSEVLVIPPSRHDQKLVDWDVKPHHKQTKLLSIHLFLPCKPKTFIFESPAVICLHMAPIIFVCFKASSVKMFLRQSDVT